MHARMCVHACAHIHGERQREGCVCIYICIYIHIYEYAHTKGWEYVYKNSHGSNSGEMTLWVG